ncbi:hypothetical protein NIE79_004728 [Micromonospora sp. NIE79]|uniref:Uncharacterized protein n=1 Tax=Micromonospora trifolii TaxID=2911208 RepID=A0ABS9N865_9ACTN|nr:hypothetical protein [Micromonospora trifolii]MCG5446161.1 hypothetical protein [Micromonospora trifolii]
MIYLNRHVTGLSLNGLVLDQDYERAGQVTKRLIGAGLGRKIIPDMIVHRRHDLGPAGNLLAIEVKTHNREDGRLHDFAKLSVLTGHAAEAIAYDKCLRLLPSDPVPSDQSFRGHVSLPASMCPYKHGLWLLLEPDGPQYWWWSSGSGPRRLACDIEP